MNVFIEMLKDRGYELCEFDKQSEINIIKDDKCNDVVVFHYTEDSKLGRKPLQTLFCEYDYYHFIIIYVKQVTAFAKNYIDSFTDKFIELFGYHELSFNVSKHYLVPKHEIVTYQKYDILKAFNIQEKHLPYILKNDPMSKYIGAKVGDIIKITRKKYETAEKNVIYRLCVNS